MGGPHETSNLKTLSKIYKVFAWLLANDCIWFIQCNGNDKDLGKIIPIYPCKKKYD